MVTSLSDFSIVPRKKNTKNVLLETRDITLLKDIFFSKVVDTETVVKRHFKQRCYNIAIRRLNILFKCGYLKKIDLSNFGKRAHAYSITDKSLKVLEQNFDWNIVRREMASDHLLHDLSLNHIVDRLKKSKGLEDLKTENELQCLDLGQFDRHLVPFRRLNSDVYLCIQSNNDLYRFSIEYERSPKTKRRWEEYLLNYHLEEDIGAVLYICESPVILKTLSGLDKKLCETYSGKIYFTTLKDFFEKTEFAIFNNIFGHKFKLHFH